MPLYQTFYNGRCVVTRKVQRKKGNDVRKQDGGAVNPQVVELKSIPAIPKEVDKKVMRRKMAAELMKEL